MGMLSSHSPQRQQLVRLMQVFRDGVIENLHIVDRQPILTLKQSRRDVSQRIQEIDLKKFTRLTLR